MENKSYKIYRGKDSYSDTDTASEGEDYINPLLEEHNYFPKDRLSQIVIDKSDHDFSGSNIVKKKVMEFTANSQKDQADFDQMRKERPIPMDTSREVCVKCKKIFTTITEANLH